MNRQFCWIFLILAISVFIAGIPADAAQSGQSGASSSPGDHGAQAGASSGSSAGNSHDSSSPAGNSGESQSSSSYVSESTTGDVSGSGTSLDPPVQSGTVMAGSGSMNGQSGTAGESAHSEPGNAGSGSSSEAGMTGGNSGLSSSARSEDPLDQMQGPGTGNQGSDQHGSWESQAGSPSGKSGDTAKNQATNAGSGGGSSRGTGAGNAAGSPDAGGQAAGFSRLEGIMLSPGNAETARFNPGSSDSTTSKPGPGRGPVPERQQQGPPAQSGGYPCAPAQSSPLSPASGQGQNESKNDSSSRHKSRRTGLLNPVIDIPDTGIPTTSPPALPFFPLSLLLFGGYRRISKSNVLEHDARQVIYQTVTERPGIEAKTLSDMTGINENTLRYHLAMLVSTGKITCFIRPGVVRYFQNQNVYSPFEQGVFHYLRTDTPRWIIGLLANHPGQTRQQIADVLGISGPSVTRQMERLIEEGIVENRLPGRSNHYTLTKDATLAINRLVSGSTVMRHDDTPMKTLLVTAH